MTLYLDTSSLVKLYVDEEGTDDVYEALASADLVATSVIAYAEARAAFARLRREKAIEARRYSRLKKIFDADWPAYLRLDVTEALCKEAGELAGRYRLRAYDSVHLASFLEVARSAGPKDVQFSSFDVRLNRAATLAVRRLGRS